MSLTLPAPVTEPELPAASGRGPEPEPDPDLVDFAAHANTRLRERDSVLYDLLAREVGAPAPHPDDGGRVQRRRSLRPGLRGQRARQSDRRGLPREPLPRRLRGRRRVERLAIDRACTAFGAQDAIVQPHSGSSANLAVITALLSPGDSLLGLDLDCGGHLTHGSPASVDRPILPRATGYGVDTGAGARLRPDRELALEHRPKLIVCGASAYPRSIDFARFRADRGRGQRLSAGRHLAHRGTGRGRPPPEPRRPRPRDHHQHLQAAVRPARRADPARPGRRAGRTGARHPAATLRRAVFPFTQGTPDLARWRPRRAPWTSGEPGLRRGRQAARRRCAGDRGAAPGPGVPAGHRWYGHPYGAARPAGHRGHRGHRRAGPGVLRDRRQPQPGPRRHHTGPGDRRTAARHQHAGRARDGPHGGRRVRRPGRRRTSRRCARRAAYCRTRCASGCAPGCPSCAPPTPCRGICRDLQRLPALGTAPVRGPRGRQQQGGVAAAPPRAVRA